jgi:adenine-specific DNA-methyltransferase
VQCIYFDPPYGIKFNSNFQWSTTSRDVKDGKSDHITREPEQVKAFRDTWRDGINSYLTYLRDRLMVARDLLATSGAVFIQINSENSHLMRNLLDEVFGEDNFVADISFRKKSIPLGARFLETMHDHILFYAKDSSHLKFKHLFERNDATQVSSHGPYAMYPSSHWEKIPLDDFESTKHPQGTRYYRLFSLLAPSYSQNTVFNFVHEGTRFPPPSKGSWVVNEKKLRLLSAIDRLQPEGKSLSYRLFYDDFPYRKRTSSWADSPVSYKKLYVVQTAEEAIARCIHMTTDPGDLVIDPTCGSGTTAYVAEQWGRRWITIDTSRVALALARARIMGARYPYYLLADSKEGQIKEASVTQSAVSTKAVHNNIRHGFVYERVPHITLKSIANNTEIDVIWEKSQQTLEPLRSELNKLLKRMYEEWEIPREAEDPWPTNAASLFQKIREEQTLKDDARPNKLKELLTDLNKELKRKQPLTLNTLPDRPADPWDKEPAKIHKQWWEARIARQKEIDASIAAKAEFEYLYDKPYEDKKKVRVAGPFTVESLSPHRTLGVDENDELIDPMQIKENRDENQSFAQMILDNLKTAGVQQADKSGKIDFVSLVPWPGQMVCAEGKYQEGDAERRAAVMIGPEFGTVQRQDLVLAAREAGDAGFDVLVACAFNFDAMSTEFNKLGRIPVLKARMNADLHMADDLKNTGKGNLFVVFGEPDIDLLDDGGGMMRVKVNGVDVFHPNTGEVRSDGPDGIACWFIDTDYNEESFFVRHAYFLGQNDPYTALKTTLKAEIDADAWSTLHSDTSRPFPRPLSGRIAVKVINHLGDEVMKVFRV